MWSELAACGSKLAPSWALQRGKHKGYIFFLSQRKFVFLLWNPKVNCDLLFFLEFDTVLHQLCLLFILPFYFLKAAALKVLKRGLKERAYFQHTWLWLNFIASRKERRFKVASPLLFFFFQGTTRAQYWLYRTHLSRLWHMISTVWLDCIQYFSLSWQFALDSASSFSVISTW